MAAIPPLFRRFNPSSDLATTTRFKPGLPCSSSAGIPPAVTPTRLPRRSSTLWIVTSSLFTNRLKERVKVGVAKSHDFFRSSVMLNPVSVSAFPSWTCLWARFHGMSSISTSPPITYLENGVPRGFDVDVLKALGEVMGRDVEIELMPWNPAPRQDPEGKAETLTGLSITEERKKSWDFATPTLTRSFSLFVKSEEVTIHSVDDLRGKRVGVTAGGIPGELLQGRPGLNLVVVANYEEGFDLLKRGGVDAIAADTWVAGYTLNKHRIEGIALAGKPFATLDSAIAVPKGHQALLQEINQGLEKLKQRGTIEAIRQKWEPKQIVYLLKEAVKAFVVWAAVIAGLILFGGMMAWLLTLRKEVKARTRAENKLRTSEGLLSEICGNVPEVFWLREVSS